MGIFRKLGKKVNDYLHPTPHVNPRLVRKNSIDKIKKVRALIKDLYVPVKLNRRKNSEYDYKYRRQMKAEYLRIRRKFLRGEIDHIPDFYSTKYMQRIKGINDIIDKGIQVCHDEIDHINENIKKYPELGSKYVKDLSSLNNLVNDLTTFYSKTNEMRVSGERAYRLFYEEYSKKKR